MKHQLAVDLGSYSIKFLETAPEGKNLKLISYEEIRLDRFKTDAYQDMSLQEVQLAIMAKFIRKHEFQGKILCHLSNEMMTTRYLDLPIGNKRKAELMIPFQLEDNLPYNLPEVHFTNSLYKKGKEIFAQVNVTEKDYFRELYKYMEERNILPAVITSELFSLQSYIQETKISDCICFIDIGHETSKAYFIDEGMIVANHTSHIAGKVIDEVIAQTYNIPIDEAVAYKHKNCFFLTESQYEKVNQDQRDFAEIMKKSISPLVMELKRWEVGFRVKFGKQINRIYITGGTSNINNIENFLSEALGVPVVQFDPYDKLHYEIVGIDEEMTNSMAVPYLMSLGQTAKLTAPNLLHGDFTGKYTDSIPLHSSSFVGARVAIFAFILLAGLWVQRAFIQQDISNLDRAAVTQLQATDLQIPRRIRDQYRVRPEVVLREIDLRLRSVNSELRALNRISQKNAIGELLSFNNDLPANENINMSRVYTDGRFFEAIFTSNRSNELLRFREHLNNLNRQNTQIFLDESENRIDFNYQLN